MKIKFFGSLCIALVLFFSTQNTKAQSEEISLKECEFMIPANWDITNYKKENRFLIMSPDAGKDVFWNVQFFSTKEGVDAGLKAMEKAVFARVKSYFPTARKMKIEKKVNHSTGLRLVMTAVSDPDEEQEITYYDAKVYITSKGLYLISTLDFCIGQDNGDLGIICFPNYEDESREFLNSFRKKKLIDEDIALPSEVVKNLFK